MMPQYTQYRPHGYDRTQRPRFAKSNNEIDRLNYSWWIDVFGIDPSSPKLMDSKYRY